MIPSDLWESIKARLGKDKPSISEKDFYTGNKFALRIDLRTFPDSNIHGGGLFLNNTRDGVKIEMMEVMNSYLKAILYYKIAAYLRKNGRIKR